ncbi:MAG: oligoribonuclease [Gammaproteobacteria bacterium]|jgi:oligoribonuclease|nr:oligoribonuclease [Gammaproteobacteria bacterium]MBT4494021.1 oligoribonuclease [Gammaproteobacteria bacterium]
MTDNSTNQNLVWMDLEMTGLEPDTDRILEVATLVTDSNLKLLAEGPVYYVRQSDEVIAGMDEWNTEHHTESGLIERVRSEGVTEREAEEGTLAFLKEHVVNRESPLCGNSIGQDRRFLVRYMPELEAYLHYRNLDVSTVKELAARWRPDVANGIVKNNVHRALDDIKESIEELRYYRDNFFNLG